ncbi:hypothetical protein [Thiocapsa rosea]|uniref:DUF5615 domain-containing protein n=1 Tax=Thiocapsa rosea TaxID=69360 RepID=A0A495VAW0_9GAMM|nr:hypothetical protein [Thiocapsa rosea]RKT44928.1 hypothetical protein BDD21_2336 [Thiocapsa rosea]
MTLRLVIDVSLSPEWVPVLTEAGFAGSATVQFSFTAHEDHDTAPL